MEHAAYALYPVIALLLAGIIGAGLAKAFRLTPIIGFFVAGAVVGPSGLNVIGESEMISLLAEIGVVLLLFDIGLHLSFRQMWRLRRDLFVMGPLQLFASASIILGLMMWNGFSWQIAILVGMGLSMSSTAIVMQMLAEKQQASSPLGQTITSILVFQDIAVVFLLMLVPILAGNSSDPVGVALLMGCLKITGALLVVYGVGKYVLQPLLRRLIGFAREELFTGAILLIILTTASFTGMVGLSLPLGAFLAGLIISETEYCYMVKAEIKPFRTLLLGLFFISVGMNLDLAFLQDHAFTILGLVIALLGIKTLSLSLVAYTQRYTWLNAGQLGLWLAQAGEFGFVLFSIAYSDQLISKDLYQTLMVVIGISFLLTPLLVIASGKLVQRFSVPSELSPIPSAKGKVIIVGFGVEGKNIARILAGAGMDYIGVDDNQQRILVARAQGFNTAHADITTSKTYDSLEAGSAHAVVLSLENDHHIKQQVTRLRSLFPQLAVFANVVDPGQLKTLQAAGIICASGDPHQTGIPTARKVLDYFDKDKKAVDHVINELFTNASLEDSA